MLHADIAVCYIVGWYLLGCGGQCEVKCICGAVSFTFSHSFTITVHCSLCVPACDVANCKDCSSDTATCDVCSVDGYGPNSGKTACEGQFIFTPYCQNTADVHTLIVCRFGVGGNAGCWGVGCDMGYGW